MPGARYLLPFIVREQYESFRALDGSDFPDAYDEWLKAHSKEKLDRTKIGYAVEERKVNPHEFALYCSDRRIPASGLSLVGFVEDMDAR